MKKNFAVLILLLILILTVHHNALAIEASAPRLITVTGDARVMIVPDRIVITLGVETLNKDLNAAKAENDRRTQKIITAARQNGVEEKYIQTDHLNIRPRYEYRPGNSREFMGYFVNKSVVLDLRDTSAFETVFGDVLEAGANSVSNIRFLSTRLRPHQDKARSLAIKAAREKASAMAKQLDQAIGRPYAIREITSDSRAWNFEPQGAMAKNISFDQADAGAGAGFQESIALGRIEVSAKVMVSFELE